MDTYIPSEYIKPHYSTKLWRAYYHFCCRHYTESLFETIIAELQMPKEYLLQDGNWVSDEFSKRFMERLRELTGDENIAENVGRFNLSPENINPFEYALLKVMPPFAFWLLMPLQFRKLNRFHEVKTVKRQPGHFHFSFIADSADPDRSFIGSLRGTWAGLEGLYSLNRLSVDHSESIQDGKVRWDVKVRYSARRFWLKTAATLAAVVSLAIFGTLGVELLSEWATDQSTTAATIFRAVTATLIVVLSLSGFAISRFLAIVRFNAIHHEQNRQKTAALFRSQSDLNRRFKEVSIQREISLRLQDQRTPTEMIEFCMQSLHSHFHYHKQIVMTLNDAKTQLETFRILGLEDLEHVVGKLSFPYPDDRKLGLIFPKILERGETILIDDMGRFSEQLSPSNRQLIDTLKVQSLIVSPIQDGKDKFGLIVVGTTMGEDKLTHDDRDLLDNISRMLSTMFRNITQYHKEISMRQLFQAYTPLVVLDELGLSTEDHSSAKAKSQELTSVFIDLRGFTSMSEHLAPAKLVELLNYFFEHTIQRISQHGGIIDNLVGDEVVAFFTSQPDDPIHHTDKAINAAVSIISEFSDLQHRFIQRGSPAPGIGIGMHTGTAVVGPVGCAGKLNFTAIGDVINTAARLQEYSKVLYCPEEGRDAIIIASDEVIRRSQNNYIFESLGNQQVRGKQTTLQLHVLHKQLLKGHSKANSSTLGSPTKKHAA